MVEFLTINRGNSYPLGDVNKNWILDIINGLPAVNNIVSSISLINSQTRSATTLLQQPAQSFPSLLSVLTPVAPPSTPAITSRGLLFLFF